MNTPAIVQNKIFIEVVPTFGAKWISCGVNILNVSVRRFHQEDLQKMSCLQKLLVHLALDGPLRFFPNANEVFDILLASKKVVFCNFLLK